MNPLRARRNALSASWSRRAPPELGRLVRRFDYHVERLWEAAKWRLENFAQLSTWEPLKNASLASCPSIKKTGIGQTFLLARPATSLASRAGIRGRGGYPAARWNRPVLATRRAATKANPARQRSRPDTPDRHNHPKITRSAVASGRSQGLAEAWPGIRVDRLNQYVQSRGLILVNLEGGASKAPFYRTAIIGLG